MLLEHAGEALPALAAAAGGDTFAPFFAGFLPLLLCKTVSALGTELCMSAVALLSFWSSSQQHFCPTRSRAAPWQRNPLQWEPWPNLFRG